MHQAQWHPEVLVQSGVHHAWVHGAGRHWETSALQLLLELGTKYKLGQFALTVGSMGRIKLAEKRSETKKKDLIILSFIPKWGVYWPLITVRYVCALEPTCCSNHLGRSCRYCVQRRRR